MAQLQQTLNPQDFPTTDGEGGLPIGIHNVVIFKDDISKNNSGDGYSYDHWLRIIDGPLEGTTGKYRQTLYHSNPVTERIGHEYISRIARAIGQPDSGIDDTEVLWEQPFQVEIVSQDDKPQYTRVKRIKPASELPEEIEEEPEIEEEEVEEEKPAPKAKTATKKPASKPAPAKSSSGKPPWMK
jgi:hypothetical protein